MRKNIEDFARKASKDKGRGTIMANAYMELFKKHTEMEYDTDLSIIKHEWKDLTSVHAYVQRNWLGPYKEWIISVWTIKYSIWVKIQQTCRLDNCIYHLFNIFQSFPQIIDMHAYNV